MNLNNLEKDLHKYYKDSSATVDTDLLWDRVQPHIPQNKKRRKVFIPIILFTGFLVAASSIYLLYNYSHETSDKSDPKLSENQIIDEKINSNHANIIQTKINNSASDTPTLSQLNPDQKENLEKDETSKYLNDNTNNISLDEGTVADDNKEAAVIVENNLPNIQKNKLLSLVTQENKSKSGLKVSQTINTQEIGISNSINRETVDNKISNNYPLIQKEAAASAKEIYSNNTDKTNLITYSLLPLISQSILDLGDDSKIGATPKKWSPRIYHRDRNKFSVEIGGGYAIPLREFTLSNSEFENTFSNRSNAESVLEGWNTRINFGYEIIPNLRVTFGLNYININERSIATITNEETYIAQDTVVGSFVRLDGSVEDIIEDAEINRTIIRNVNRINSYKYLNIPIELVYSVPLRRMTFDIGTGFSKNISLNASGYWHPDESTEYDLSSDSENYLKDSNGLSIIGHLGMSFNISPSFGLYARGRFIHQLSTSTQGDYGINQKYQLIGSEIGMRTFF